MNVDDDAKIEPELLRRLWKLKRAISWPVGNLAAAGGCKDYIVLTLSTSLAELCDYISRGGCHFQTRSTARVAAGRSGRQNLPHRVSILERQGSYAKTEPSALQHERLRYQQLFNWSGTSCGRALVRRSRRYWCRDCKSGISVQKTSADPFSMLVLPGKDLFKTFAIGRNLR